MIDCVLIPSSQSYVEHHQLLPGQPHSDRPHDVHLQLYPLLYIHERQVGGLWVFLFKGLNYNSGYELQTLSLELNI